MYVIKRDGRKEEFDIQKIRKQLEFARKPTKLSQEEIEAKISIIFKNGIKTSEIQESLINTFLKEINAETPDYNIFVGRLKTYDLYRNVYKLTKFEPKDWEAHIEYLVRNNYYRKEVLDRLKEVSEHTKKKINRYIEHHNYDFHLVAGQIFLLENKYLIKNKRGVIEYPFLCDIANALLLSKDDDEFYEMFELLNQNYISLATPFKRNLRRVDGNTGSCFQFDFDDNLASIMKCYTDIAFISKEGGGVGVYLGKIRPSNTYSPKIVKSNKINKWIKIINDIAVAVDQAGVRKAGITVALPWWHLDIEDFITIKSELKGDLRDKCFDIFPQVVFDRWFMEKVKAKEDVYIFNHYEFRQKTGIDITEVIDEELHKALDLAQELAKEGKITAKKMKANEFWKEALQTWIEIGDFYLVNVEGLNKSNYLKHFGITKAANLCTESFSLSKVAKEWKEVIKNEKRIIEETDGMYHSCNLISINISKFKEISDEWVQKLSYYSVLMLDRSIDLSTYPVKEAEKGSKLLRNIGIGFVGVADFMAWNKKMFNKKEDIKFIQGIIEKFAYNIYKSSIELAKKYGAYPLFDKAKYDKLFGYTIEELNKFSPNGYDWSEIQKEIKEYGIRNFLLLAIAPNTSTAVLMNASPSYLPVYNKEGYQTFNDIIVPIVPKWIKERYWYYKTKFQYHPNEIIAYTREIQKFIDTGISMEINLNPEIEKDISKISNAIIDGFLTNELKAVYYSLTIDNNKNKDAKKSCEDCAN